MLCGNIDLRNCKTCSHVSFNTPCLSGTVLCSACAVLLLLSRTLRSGRPCAAALPLFQALFQNHAHTTLLPDTASPEGSQRAVHGPDNNFRRKLLASEIVCPTRQCRTFHFNACASCDTTLAFTPARPRVVCSVWGHRGYD